MIQNLSLFIPESNELMLPSGETRAIPDVVIQQAKKAAPTEVVRSWAIRKGLIGLSDYVGMFSMPATSARAAQHLAAAA